MPLVTDRFDGDSIIGLAQGEIVWQQAKTLLRPEGVGGGECHLSFLLQCLETGGQGRKSGVENIRGEIEMQRLPNLFLRFASRTAGRHGRRGRDAIGREEDITIPGAQFAVEIKREFGVASHQLLGIGRGFFRMARHGPQNRPDRQTGESETNECVAECLAGWDRTGSIIIQYVWPGPPGGVFKFTQKNVGRTGENSAKQTRPSVANNQLSLASLG